VRTVEEVIAYAKDHPDTGYKSSMLHYLKLLQHSINNRSSENILVNMPPDVFKEYQATRKPSEGEKSKVINIPAPTLNDNSKKVESIH
jgi:hypothetical protein